MTQWIYAMFKVLFACAMMWQLAGCSSADQTIATLSALQQGKAQGHLIITTSGALSAGQTMEFFLGAKGTTLAFDGDINFTDANFDELNEALSKIPKETAKGEE